MIRTGLISAILALGLAASSSAATLLTVDYTATRAGGGTVAGSFGYFLDAVDRDPSPFAGEFDGFLNGLVTGGPQDGFSFSIDPAVVFVDDNALQSFNVRDAVDFDIRLIMLTSGNVQVDFDDLPTNFDVSGPPDNFEVSIANSLLDASFTGEEIYLFDPATLVVTQTVVDPSQIPLPASGFLILGGLAALCLAGRRRRPFEA